MVFIIMKKVYANPQSDASILTGITTMPLVPNVKLILTLVLLAFAFHPHRSESKEVVIPSGINWPPYSYMDKEGVLIGTDIELMRKALNKIGYSLKHRAGVPIRRLTKHNEFLDINANIATTYNTDRAKRYYFSTPYRTEAIAIYYIDKKYDGLKTAEEFLKQAEIVSLNQSAFLGEDFQVLASKYHHKLFHQETAQRRFMQLLAGKVDIVLADVANATSILSDVDYSNLKRSSFYLIEQEVSFAFLKSEFDQDFIGDFNKALAKLIE